MQDEGQSGKIRHTSGGLGQPVPDDLSSVAVSEETGEGPKEIRALGMKTASSRHEDSWIRTPNTTGAGAIHVRSFHCKVTEDGLAYMDQQINEWLDAHPQYEVKFVQTVLGTFTGKIKEPHVISQVWV